MKIRFLGVGLVVGVLAVVLLRRNDLTGSSSQPLPPGEAFLAGSEKSSGSGFSLRSTGSSSSRGIQGRAGEVLSDSPQPFRSVGDLRARLGAEASVVDDAAGRPAFIGGFKVAVEGKTGVRELAAALAPFFGVPAGQLGAEPTFVSTGERTGGAFVFQQRIGGYLVRDGELRLQVSRDAENRAWLTDVQASLHQTVGELRDGDLTPSKAAEGIKGRPEGTQLSPGAAEPLVVVDGSGVPHACWQVVVTVPGQLPRHVYVSRKTGEVVDELPGAVR